MLRTHIKKVLECFSLHSRSWQIFQRSGGHCEKYNWEKYLRWLESLDGRLRLSNNTIIYHAHIAKYVLALNKVKPEVPYGTLKSFGKYLKMWKFHQFPNIQVFFQRPKRYISVCQTDKVPRTKKYTNVQETYWYFAWERSLHHICFTLAALTSSFSN